MENNEIQYKISNENLTFEGPLSLILHLIHKNKMDIFDIPISELIEQYLQYMDTLKEVDIDLMASFIEMAATLLEIKSRMLMSYVEMKDDEEGDPREELVRRLLEYKKYKDLGHDLTGLEKNAPEYMFKGPTIPNEVKKYVPAINYDELLNGIDMEKINKVFLDVIRRKADSIDPIRSGFSRIEKERRPLRDVIIYVENFAEEKKKFSFRDFLDTGVTKEDVIVLFLAMLELMKVGRIKVSQEFVFDDIIIENVEGSKAHVDFRHLEDA